MTMNLVNNGNSKIITGPPVPLEQKFAIMKNMFTLIIRTMISDVYNMHTPAEQASFAKKVNTGITPVIKLAMEKGLKGPAMLGDPEIKQKLAAYTPQELNLYDITNLLTQIEKL